MGGLIDRTVSFWRAHWKALFGLTVGFQLAQYALSKAYLFALPHIAPVMANPKLLREASEGESVQVLFQVAAMAVSVSLLVVVSGWLNWLTTVAVTAFSLPRWTAVGEVERAPIRRAIAKAGTVTFAYLLSLLWAAGMGVLCTLPGVAFAVGLPMLAGALGLGSGWAVAAVVPGVVLLLLGWATAFVWYLLRFTLTSTVIAAEPLGAVAAVRRSGALLSGRLGPGFFGRNRVRASVVVSAMLVVLFVLSIVTSLPASVLQLALRDPDDPFGVSRGLGLTALTSGLEIVGTLAQSVFSPLYLLLAVALYVDLRVRKEGLDLELRLDGLERTPG